MFVQATFEGWMEIMRDAVDAREVGMFSTLIGFTRFPSVRELVQTSVANVV